MEHKYVSSSKRVAKIWIGTKSTNRSDHDSKNARPLGGAELVHWHRHRLRQRWPLLPRRGCPRHPNQPCRCTRWRAGGRQLAVRSHQRLLSGVSSGELSDICSKSSRAFPIISNTTSVLASRSSVVSSRRRSQAISDCSAVSFPILSPGCFPARTPASRKRRHSAICEEYSPSLRK